VISIADKSKPIEKRTMGSFIFDNIGRSMYISHTFAYDIAPRLKGLLNESVKKTYGKPEFEFGKRIDSSIISDGKKAIIIATVDHVHTRGLAWLLRGLGVTKTIDFDQMERDGFMGEAKTLTNNFGFDYIDSGIGGKFSSWELDFKDRESGFEIHVVPKGTNVERLINLIHKHIQDQKPGS
jgi:hypothetical protein